MKKIILFLLVGLSFVSCSRIVSADYPLLDEGVIDSITYNQKTNIADIWITNSKDSVSHCWHKKSINDDLSMWGMTSNELEQGDYAYVYRKNKSVIASRKSVVQAKAINRVAWKFYKNKLAVNWPTLGISTLIIALVVMFYKKSDALIWISLLEFILLVSIIHPGDTLILFDFGRITSVEEHQVTIDNCSVYSIDRAEDFVFEKPILKGDSVFVYTSVNSEKDLCLSKTEINDKLLDAQQIYPERLLYSILLVCATVSGWLIVIKLFIRCIFSAKKRLLKKKVSA